MATNKVNLDLTRKNVCDILIAIINVKTDFIDEIADPTTSEDKRKIAKASLDMWDKLYKEIKIQL